MNKCAKCGKKTTNGPFPGLGVYCEKCLLKTFALMEEQQAKGLGISVKTLRRRGGAGG